MLVAIGCLAEVEHKNDAPLGIFVVEGRILWTRILMRIRDLRIQGFRAFNDLRLFDLRSVNLLVGKNNVGKTTILEALRIFFTDDPYRITELLLSRDEFSLGKRRMRRVSTVSSIPIDAPLAFESVFFGRPDLASRPRFTVGPPDARGLTVRFVWLSRIEDEATGVARYALDFSGGDGDSSTYPGFEIDSDARSAVLLPWDRLERPVRRRFTSPVDQSVIFLPASGLQADELGQMWDRVVLTEDEDAVICALRSIVPTLERLVLIQNPVRNASRLIMAKISEFPDPVPFRSLGDGTLHILNVVLALFAARNGVLLVDEIESGLHYSIQQEFWSIILRQAKAWGVQVFATTHSWDCVRGFQGASELLDAEAQESTRLFRIERVGEAFKTTVFTSEELKIAQREDIEFR